MTIERLVVGALEANCYLAAADGELLIIDPGDEAERIATAVLAARSRPAAIVLTHAHPDHSGAVGELKRRFGVPVLAHRDEIFADGFAPDRTVGDGDEIPVGRESLRVVHTPGHTPGSVCLFAGAHVLTGDTVFLNGYGRTDLPFGDEEALKRSLERLSELIGPGMTVHSGHGPSFRIEEE
jgi:hydroxyacylglutathione hydrolase